MDLSRGIESHSSHWCQQFRHSWMWHLTERETKQGMLANTLVNKGSHFFFWGISHRLTQNLLYLLFTVTKQFFVCTLFALSFCELSFLVQMATVDHMAPYLCFLWQESSYQSSVTQGYGILFASAEDAWKTLKNTNEQIDRFYSGGE